MPHSVHIAGGRIWTGDPRRSWASSLTIDGGLVTALDEHRKPGQQGLNADNAVVLPGLIDAHLHMLLGGKSLGELDLSEVRSRAEFKAAIRRRHAELSTGKWLIASGWSEERWGGERPDKTWLAAAGTRPCVCYRADIHAALVNDAVLAMCEVDRPLRGGEVVRDPDTGQPTGLMLEAAAWELVNPIVPSATLEEKRAALRSAMRFLNSMGVTAAASMEYGADAAGVFTSMRNELTVRTAIVLLDRAYPTDFTLARSFKASDCLRITGFKAFLDGTLGSRTARMLAPYLNNGANCGMWLERAAEGTLDRWAKAVHDAGYQISMHAIGDAAFRKALDVLDGLGAGELVHRIEHAQQVDRADVPRCRGRLLSMQPLHQVDDAAAAKDRLGEGRMAGFFAFRDLIDAGATLAFGSDWPVVSPDPMLGIQAAVTGRVRGGHEIRPERCVSPAEAVAAYTTGAAHALTDERIGRLLPGSWGDCVMLDRDPFTCDWARALPRVLKTIVGGKVVYDASGSSVEVSVMNG